MEVNQSFCKQRSLRTKANQMEDLRHLSTLKRNNCTYAPSRYHEVIYMRCSDCVYLGEVGTLYITGTGNVFCGGIEFDLVVTGQNNSVYRVVAC